MIQKLFYKLYKLIHQVYMDLLDKEEKLSDNSFQKF